MKDAPLVQITIEFDAIFTLDELWPDGDYPSDMIDRDSVMELLKRDGIYNVPREWFFPDPDVHIGFTGFDLTTGKPRHAERLWVGEGRDPSVPLQEESLF